MTIFQLLFYGFLIISIIPLIYYIFLIRNYTKGWIKLPENPIDIKSYPLISVVIACRNEESSIENLVTGLLNQKYPQEKYEIIIIDDFSDDSTIAILNRYKDKITILSSHLPGKKNAISCGIEKASGELILTTDADCIVPDKWILSHAKLYEAKGSVLQLAPVDFLSKNKFQAILNLEFFSLIGSAAGSTAIGKPIMGNAANMSFSKKIYCELKEKLNTSIPSGDDVFLLQEAKKNYSEKIFFLKDKNCIVKTEPPQNLTAFFNQRIRWASKNKHYSDKDIISTGINVFILNFLILLSLVISLFNIFYFLSFIILFTAKSIADYSLLSRVSLFFNKKYLLRLFLPVQIIYPFYVVTIGFLSFFVKYSWKGRKF